MNKVLAIAPYNYLPYFSGGQKLVAQFLEYLGKGTDLTVITVAENDFSLTKSYSTIPLLKRSFSRYIDLGLVSKITSLIKKEKFDTVIWEHPYYAWLATIVKKRTGIKTIIHTHNIEHRRFRSTGRWWWPILQIYEKWCFKKADHIFFITPEDKKFALENWKIRKEKCLDVPFGIEIDEYPRDRADCRRAISARHHLNGNETILLFNGLLDYKPNLDALIVILDEINPALMAEQFQYKIIVCGKRLPPQLNELKDYSGKNVIYAGFVNDIDNYFKAADLFLNPVQSGGGIKTKMVEAIGYGTTVIATETGALGINKTVCGNKLMIVPDNEWKNFAKTIIEEVDHNEQTPPFYYSYYYWENIIQKVLNVLPDQPSG